MKKPPEYEAHEIGTVQANGNLYLHRKYAGKKVECWIKKDEKE